MIELKGLPGSTEKYVRLLDFCMEILGICHDLGISPVLSGSLAVFAYTGRSDINVNDVDLACSETQFPEIIHILEERSIQYHLKAWHVLQIIRDDLKVDLDSLEYWYRDLPMHYEILLIGDYKVNLLDLESLKTCYRRGMENTVDKTEEIEQAKFKQLKAKYEALEKVET